MKKIIFLFIVIVLALTGFAQQIVALNPQEKDDLLFMREEEKLARDVYEILYTKWNSNPFGNIRKSEQVHMDRMKILITTYKLVDPVENNKNQPGIFENALLQKYYNELVTVGYQSFTEALKVGAKIEELDINDLEKGIVKTKQEDILSTYNFLKMASENHLRAFVRRLKMQGVDYKPLILNKTAFDQIIAAENNMGDGKRKWN